MKKKKKKKKRKGARFESVFICELETPRVTKPSVSSTCSSTISIWVLTSVIPKAKPSKLTRKDSEAKMEKRQRFGVLKAQIFIGILLLTSFIGRISSLSVTVNDVECVYEYVLYEDDTISGNFVVVDHDIFWSSDHPGIDFTVSPIFPPNFTILDLVHFYRV